MTRKATTPWGPSEILEEVKVTQRAGTKTFASTFQLLEASSGEALVRIAYTTGGTARRGPVTLRRHDLEQLRSKLAEGSPLAAAFGWGGGGA
jgi:hypothetical protein